MTANSMDKPLYSLVATLGLITLTGYLLVIGEQILLPLVLAILVSYLITALGHRIERLHIGKWRPPAWMGLSGAVLAVVLIVGLIVQLVASNISEVIDGAPRYQVQFQNLLTKITDLAAKYLNRDRPITVTAVLEEINIRDVLERFALAFQSIAGNTFQVLAYVTFLLLERRMFDRKLSLLFPDPSREQTIRATFKYIGNKIEAYMLIKTGISLLNGVLSYIVLTLFNVDFAGFWALLVFVLNFIPYIGSPIAMLFPTLLALLQFGSIVMAAFVLGSLWAIQAFVENFIEPRITGRTLNLSPLVMIVALSVWGAIWGITGMILSVPLMVMIMIILSQFPKTRPIAIVMSERGEIV
ncbi:MAG: AI-2E family transporter [Proteobacteria bacterium]|nr:AI-2E family transporter [Pseudomonadota bacterium]